MLKNLIASATAARPAAVVKAAQARNTATAIVEMSATEALAFLPRAVEAAIATLPAFDGEIAACDLAFANVRLGSTARGLAPVLGRREIWQAAYFTPLGFRNVLGLDMEPLTDDCPPAATVASYRAGMEPVIGWVNVATGEWLTAGQAADLLHLDR